MSDINKTIKQLEADIDRAKRTGEILVYVGRATARDCLELLKEQPQVVRCKDCIKNSGHGKGIYADFVMCYDTGARHPEDWYCANGTLKDNA